MKRLIVIYLVSMVSVLTAQKGNTDYRGGEVECGGGDFGFSIDGQLYTSGSDYYVCRDNLPITIILADVVNNTVPYISGSYTWENATSNDSLQWQAVIDTTHFGSKDLLKTKVTFYDGNGNKKTAKLKVNTDLSFIKLKGPAACHALAQYAYDENSFSNYPFYEKDVPWKFLLGSQADKLPLERKVTRVPDINTVLSDSGPMALDQTLVGTELEIEHIAGARDSVYSHVCGSHSLFRADVYDQMKTYDLHIWTARESDDDEINYCATNRYLQSNCADSIAAADHVCLLQGPDLTFDMFFSPNQPWIDQSLDSVIAFQTPGVKIMAGKDLKCDSDIMKTSNVEAPAVFNTANLVANTNAILNTAGIQVNFIDHGSINLNFDIVTEDNIAESVEGFDAIDRAKVTLDTVSSSAAFVIFFPDLSEPTVTLPAGGTATRYGRSRKGNKTSIIDGNKMRERTVAHELGHSIWSLLHQDEDTINNDPTQDGLVSKVTNDSANLMTSGSGAGSNVNVNNSFIRRYVWKIMQDGR